MGDQNLERTHTPVLFEEVIGFFDRAGVETIVDGTLGGGGHAEGFLQRIDALTTFIGIDRDIEAVRRCEIRLNSYQGVLLFQGRFIDIDVTLDKIGIESVDGILLDLGVSSFQLDNPDRGFSFIKDGPLDMRMDVGSKTSAADLVNQLGADELATIFHRFGEERFAKRISRAIVREREDDPILSTLRLAHIVESAIPAASRPRVGGSHPATRVFQALRIAVNDELDSLREAIKRAISRLSVGGRIAIITFHSLEDRIVKQTFFDLCKRCVCPKDLPVCVCGEPGLIKTLTHKPITPEESEISENVRSRSAKLRVAERLGAS